MFITEIIYVQTKLNGQSSPELALEIGKKIDSLLFFTHMVETCTILFMSVLDLDR